MRGVLAGFGGARTVAEVKYVGGDCLAASDAEASVTNGEGRGVGGGTKVGVANELLAGHGGLGRQRGGLGRGQWLWWGGWRRRRCGDRFEHQVAAVEHDGEVAVRRRADALEHLII